MNCTSIVYQAALCNLPWIRCKKFGCKKGNGINFHKLIMKVYINEKKVCQKEFISYRQKAKAHDIPKLEE